MKKATRISRGGRLYFEAAGSGDVVVLIHDNMGDRRIWDAQFNAFAERWRVIRYDARGFGRSSVPVERQPYSHHDDLAALLEHLGVNQAHVIGQSMGAGIGTDFVLAYPDMSSSLLSVGPWVSGYVSAAADDMRRQLFGEIPSILQKQGPKAVVDRIWSVPYNQRALHGLPVNDWFLGIAYDYSFWHFEHKDPVRGRSRPQLAVRWRYEYRLSL